MDIEHLEELSQEQLRALRDDIDRALKTYERRRRAAAISAAEEVARAHGLKLSDLVGTRTTRMTGKAPPAGARYANPENPSETWSGRGRRPAWVKAALESGQSLETFAI